MTERRKITMTDPNEDNLTLTAPETESAPEEPEEDVEAKPSNPAPGLVIANVESAVDFTSQEAIPIADSRKRVRTLDTTSSSETIVSKKLKSNEVSRIFINNSR